MDFKDLYRIEAEKHKISEEMMLKTKQKLYKQNKPPRRFVLRTAVILGLLAGCMTITAFAYEYRQYMFQSNNVGAEHKYLNSEEGKIQEVNKTATADHISVTVKTVAADEKNLYALIGLKTTDGSPLNINTDEDVTFLKRQGFEKACFVVDGKSTEFNAGFRVDDGSDPSSAVIELIYNCPEDAGDSLENLSGKEIKIILDNYKYEVDSNRSIGFAYSDSRAMLENQVLARENEFSPVGIFIKYADGSSRYSYTLASGDKKIYFSKEYSKTYIDNAGLYKSGEMERQNLYVSIVPENDKVREELLKNLVLFNQVTGEYIHPQQPHIGDSDGSIEVFKNADGSETYNTDARDVQPDDGRIVLIFDAGTWVYNEQRECDGVDTTRELLKDYILKLYTSSRTEIVENTWEIDFTLGNINKKLTYRPDMEVSKGEGSLKVNTIEVGDTFISIQGKGSSGFNLKPMGKIYLLLKDGTKVDAGVKMGGGYEEGSGKFDMEINLQTFVNAEDVTGIILWDQAIPLK